MTDDFAGREAKCASCEAEFLLPLASMEAPGLGSTIQEAIQEQAPQTPTKAAPERRPGFGGFLLALLFAAATGAGIWWVMQAAISPTQEGFQPIDSIWARFVGRFHPLIVHLPIGILTLAALMEGLRLLSRRPERLAPAMTVVLWAASLSCMAAIAVGYLLVLDGGPGVNERLLEQHIIFGLGFAVAVAAALIFWHLYQWRGHPALRWVFRFVLVAAFVVMSTGAHYGGTLVHGPTYLTRHMPEELKPWAEKLGLIDTAERPQPVPPRLDPPQDVPVDPDPEEEIETPEDPAEEPGTGEPVTVMVYRDLVDPVFELKCMECHEEGNAKGRFRMDLYTELMRGGSFGKSIIPGSATESELVVRLFLPMDDDERMPPSDREQLTEMEIALIQWWIDEGATEDHQVAVDDLPDPFRTLLPPAVHAAR